jgi:hypothetical protein
MPGSGEEIRGAGGPKTTPGATTLTGAGEDKKRGAISDEPLMISTAPTDTAATKNSERRSTAELYRQ